MCAIPAVCFPPLPQVKNPSSVSFSPHHLLGGAPACICANATKAGFRWLTISRLRYSEARSEMRHSLHLPIAPGKKLAASLCLLAVLLIWAPAWAAVLQSHQMDCCADGLCPAHGGHHSKSSEPASHPAQSPIDCDQHHGSQQSSGLAPCSLSCCHDSDHPTTTAVIFVLPAPTQIAEPAVAHASAPRLALTDFAHVSDPLSPPPRT